MGALYRSRHEAASSRARETKCRPSGRRPEETYIHVNPHHPPSYTYTLSLSHSPFHQTIQSLQIIKVEGGGGVHIPHPYSDPQSLSAYSRPPSTTCSSPASPAPTQRHPCTLYQSLCRRFRQPSRRIRLGSCGRRAKRPSWTGRSLCRWMSSYILATITYNTGKQAGWRVGEVTILIGDCRQLYGGFGGGD